MRTARSGLLFSGAIFAAGVAAGEAQGGVSSPQFTLEGDLQFNYFVRDYSIDYPFVFIDTGNQSFSAQGGIELAPFDRGGRGGYAPDLDFGSSTVRTRMDATLSGGGALWADFGVAASSHPRTYGSSGQGVAIAYALIEFTVSDTETFTLGGTGGQGGTNGWWSVILTDDVGTEIFEESGSTPSGSSTSFDTSGTLGPGSYALTLRSYADMNAAGGSSGASAVFTVTPTPATAGVFGVLGIIAARRRR